MGNVGLFFLSIDSLLTKNSYLSLGGGEGVSNWVTQGCCPACPCIKQALNPLNINEQIVIRDSKVIARNILKKINTSIYYIENLLNAFIFIIENVSVVDLIIDSTILRIYLFHVNFSRLPYRLTINIYHFAYMSCDLQSISHTCSSCFFYVTQSSIYSFSVYALSIYSFTSVFLNLFWLKAH